MLAVVDVAMLMCVLTVMVLWNGMVHILIDILNNESSWCCRWTCGNKNDFSHKIWVYS